MTEIKEDTMGRTTTKAREVVEAARTLLAQWEASKAAAEAELESLQQRAGSEVLDDPEAASTLPRVMQQLRDQVDIAARAIEAQRPRVKAAEAAFLEAEADALEAPAKRAREALAKHDVRTQELLGQLAQHEGPYVPEQLLLDARERPLAAGETREIKLTRGQVLRQESLIAEKKVWVLRELAAGRDPHPHLMREGSIVDGRWAGLDLADLYAPCVWGPDAVVPAPQYLRAASRTPAAAATPVDA